MRPEWLLGNNFNESWKRNEKSVCFLFFRWTDFHLKWAVRRSDLIYQLQTKILRKMSSQPGQNFVFVIFTRFYPPLFIRHVVRFVHFQWIRLMDWIGLYGNLQMASLTTSETKCDIATTWGRVRGAIINDFFVAVFGTPLSIWRTIQLSNISPYPLRRV